jgi:hypothetical protein
MPEPPKDYAESFLAYNISGYGRIGCAAILGCHGEADFAAWPGQIGCFKIVPPFGMNTLALYDKSRFDVSQMVPTRIEFFVSAGVLHGMSTYRTRSAV